MAALIGIDVGGSGIRGAKAAGSGIGPIVTVAHHARDEASILAAVASVVAQVADGEPVDGVGVGLPGFVSEGVVLALPNLPGFEGVRFSDQLSARIGARVRAENDANLAALGAWARHGRPDHFLLLTLGTGVGGGIISGGRLLTGARGVAGEVGHLWVGGDRRCGCGAVGCLETRAGTVGMVAAAAERGHVVANGGEVVAAARAGEAWAAEIVHDAGLSLGRGLQSLVNTLNPSKVVLAGGLARAADLLDPPLRTWLWANGVKPAVERLELVWEDRADELAILGGVEVARS